MPRGRKRRLKNFEKRAEAFYEDMQNAKNTKFLKRDGKLIEIGTGTNRRLVEKRHLKNTFASQKKIFDYLQEKLITPKNYELVPVAEYFGVSTRSQGFIQVQEYFHRPSVAALKSYLDYKNAQRALGTKKAFEKYRTIIQLMSREEFLLCKRFTNQNKGVSYLSLFKKAQEFEKHLKEANVWIDEKNIIILGVTSAGKLRLAIVDV